MSKFIKGSLIMAGFFAALGFILCLISAVFGGTSLLHLVRDEYVSGRLSDVEEIVENYAHRMGNAGWRGSKVSGTLVVNDKKADGTGWSAQESMEGVENIELVLGAGTFVIREKDVSDGMIDIYMQGTGDCDYHVKKDTFYMEGFKRNMLDGNIGDNIVTLEFPAGTNFHEIDVEIGAGHMEMYDLSAVEIEAEVGAGEFEMCGIQADRFSLEIGAGTCDAQDVHVGTASISAGMGECCYEGMIEKNLEAECGMGNMEFNLAGKESDHNYKIECSMGSVNLGGMEYSALSSEKEIDNGAHGTYEIECSMGHVSVQFQDN